VIVDDVHRRHILDSADVMLGEPDQYTKWFYDYAPTAPFFPYSNTLCICVRKASRTNAELGKIRSTGLSNVMLMQAALWPVQRRLTISDDGAGEWAYSVTEQRAAESTNEVSAITMEDILRKLAVSRIDLLKLDIEGSERELFSTDAGAWLDRVEYIVVELHDRYRPG
jgi:FkbM family methyltransferase